MKVMVVVGVDGEHSCCTANCMRIEHQASPAMDRTKEGSSFHGDRGNFASHGAPLVELDKKDFLSSVRMKSSSADLMACIPSTESKYTCLLARLI